VVSHRLQSDGQLELVGRTPAGREPRAIAMARNGDYAVVVNSIDNQVAAMSIGDDGLLREVSRISSGGLNPYDVAVAHEDVVVVANRDSNQINTFHIDRRGQLRPLSQASTGLAPHVVAVSRRGGWVAVCNQTDRTMQISAVNRNGIPVFAGVVSLDDMSPITASWQGRQVFVALDKAFPQEDVIRSYAVDRRGGVTQQGGDTNAGVFLNDLEANEDGLFAVTANRNDPDDPTDDRNEVRVYRIENGTNLVWDASVQTEGFPPSFQQVSTGPARRPNDRHVIVSKFQSGELVSLLYDRRRPPPGP
jgi:6-phosphogluconolactonase (cycloisomerase 2 family)